MPAGRRLLAVALRFHQSAVGKNGCVSVVGQMQRAVTGPGVVSGGGEHAGRLVAAMHMDMRRDKWAGYCCHKWLLFLCSLRCVDACVAGVVGLAGGPPVHGVLSA